MDTIGAEVGQKMRSAIKAKLLELECYVDDELPDYIMVMVANKRTKSQMSEDLNLFLSDKTSVFVEWLHIVLKKLKEVTVTNPDVYKRVAKRRSEVPDLKTKKEKRSKKINEALKPEDKSDIETVSKFSDKRKITVLDGTEKKKEHIVNDSQKDYEDGFDIPLLSEVNATSEDLEAIEKKIRNVKSRLGLLVDSDLEIEIDDIKSEQDKLLKIPNKSQIKQEKDSNEDDETPSSSVEPLRASQSYTPDIDSASKQKKRKYTPITFETETPPKKNILERLGKKPVSDKRENISTSGFRKDVESFLRYSSRDRKCDRERSEERDDERRIARRNSSKERRRDKESRKDRSEMKKEQNRNVLSRLGVLSKVSIPLKETESESEDELRTRAVRSMVKVKPRVIPSDVTQPNKNLLLKAVAEAHRSIAQSLNSTGSKSKKTQKRSRCKEEERRCNRKLPQSEKNKLRNIILSHVSHDKNDDREDKEVYIPKPIKQSSRDIPRYIPSSNRSSTDTVTESKDNEDESSEKCAIRSEDLEGTTNKETNNDGDSHKIKPSIKLRLQEPKPRSPISFQKDDTRVKLSKSTSRMDIPDRLPVVHQHFPIKKERCKYWPNCRLGDKCEFVHPISNCEMFPNCKYRDNCLFLHPPCKFGSSCTKRGCTYSHAVGATSAVSRGPMKVSSTTLQQCKYFPNCANMSCPFYHPKLCKFGRYCQNQTDCPFSHLSIRKKSQ